MKNRIFTVFIIFSFLFAVVIGKAFYIQVITKNKLIAYARSQFMRESKEYPHRGNILDRNGSPLAINVHKYTMHTFPTKKNKVYFEKLKTLSKIVPELNYKKLYNLVKNRNKYTYIARQISLTESQVEKIKKLEIINIEGHTSRVYPNHELVAQTLGFVGIDNAGLAGVELSQNKKLRGDAKIVRYYKDAKGRKIKYETQEGEHPAEDVTLAIDQEIQGALESYLKEAVDTHQASKGGAAVMDAETGEIWAIANYPTYDPARATSYSLESRKLSFVTDPFEPGSIFKTLTIASALENDVATINKKYYCEKGKLKVQNHIISEAESDKKFEWLTVGEILKYSSNVGTTKIAFDLGYEKLKKTIDKFQLGTKTGIEVKGESKGIVSKSKKVKPLTLSNISFGHGIATTPIQMLRTYAAIANGGYLIKPTLFKNDESQLIKENKILKNKTVEQLQEMLVYAVEKGTGTNAVIPHYEIAGKTGTAQRVNPNGGGYSGYIASFIGFPINVNKKFVVFAYVEQPTKGGYYGNVVASPIFKKITQYILYKKKDFAQYAIYSEKENDKNLDLVKLNQSSSRQIYPGRMPNLMGLDKNAALAVMESIKSPIEMTGFGVVSTQYPDAGVPISEVSQIRIHFTPPKYEE
jgi:cell division protein FtsI (penicillin-binding protein 3)